MEPAYCSFLPALLALRALGCFPSVGEISRLAELKSTKNKELLYFISSRVEVISGWIFLFQFLPISTGDPFNKKIQNSEC